MRILVILSPTNKYGTKGEYTRLRKFLKSDGYLRISEEVFMRITTNRLRLPRNNIRIFGNLQEKMIIKKKWLGRTCILCYDII